MGVNRISTGRQLVLTIPALSIEHLRNTVRQAVLDEGAAHPGRETWYPAEHADAVACRVVTELLTTPKEIMAFCESIENSSSTATPERFPRTVTCAWCGNRYRSACPDDLDRGLQGSHCASDVVQEGNQWIVRGGYGSDEHDLHRYLFVANPPSAPADPVCDECISQRWQAGDLHDTGLKADRRPSDFSPRPLHTWGLVQQIRELVRSEVALRRVVDAACREHAVPHGGDACQICEAIREYRKYQRFTGEIDDGGAEYLEGCREVAEQMREAASRLQDLATRWERRAPKATP